jgi:FtsZ-binding cell division protein ZapB
MNDLKESHETIKQTTDELKKQQDDLKTIIDTLNKEKNDWVDFHIFVYSVISLFSGEKN